MDVVIVDDASDSVSNEDQMIDRKVHVNHYGPAVPNPIDEYSPFLTVERIAGLDHGVDGDTFEKNPIITIAVHPVETTMIATGGHEGSVRLWSLDFSMKVDPRIKDVTGVTMKQINSLVGHSGQVNTVRFSPITGDFLASCSSDSSIRVYNKDSHWKLLNSLRGHTLDVTDIAWFNATGLLISCSTDGKVIVWDVITGGKLQTVTPDKGSAPKGLLIDPYRDYFCVLHDDSLIDIYRRQADGKFRHSRHIDLGKDDPKNFSKSTKTTVYPRRGSWDASKASLILPLGSRVPKSVGPCGVFYERANLLEPTPGELLVSRKVLTGHPARVVLTTCMPCLREDDSFVTGMASVDGVISLWLSNQSEPMAVIANALGHLGVFTDSAWIGSRALLLSSSDGAVTCVSLHNIGKFKKSDHEVPSTRQNVHAPGQVTTAITGDVKAAQVETRVGGKRKIQPVIASAIVSSPNETLQSVPYPVVKPTILPELSSIIEGSQVAVKNLTHSFTVSFNGATSWTFEGCRFSKNAVVTCVSHNSEYVVLGLYDDVAGDALLCIVNAEKGGQECLYIQMPEFVSRIRISASGIVVLLIGECSSVAVWSMRSEAGQSQIQAIVPDAVLTGLFRSDKIVDLQESEGVPNIHLASGKRAVYHLGIRRWVMIG
jgi:WD40 repeat protein